MTQDPTTYGPMTQLTSYDTHALWGPRQNTADQVTDVPQEPQSSPRRLSLCSGGGGRRRRVRKHVRMKASASRRDPYRARELAVDCERLPPPNAPFPAQSCCAIPFHAQNNSEKEASTSRKSTRNCFLSDPDERERKRKERVQDNSQEPRQDATQIGAFISQ